jgi:hypothetical protein
MDRPLYTVDPPRAVIVDHGYLNYCSGVEHFERLDMYPNSQDIPSKPDFNRPFDEMDVSNIICRSAYAGSLTFDTTSTNVPLNLPITTPYSSANQTDLPIGPMWEFYLYSLSTTPTKYSVSPLSANASQFSRWRGSFRYRITFHITSMVAFRFGVAVVRGTLIQPKATSIASTPNFITFDVNSENHVFEILVPYVAPVPTLEVYSGGFTPSLVQSCFTGNISFWLMAPLVATSVVSNTVNASIDVFPDQDFYLDKFGSNNGAFVVEAPLTFYTQMAESVPIVEDNKVEGVVAVGEANTIVAPMKSYMNYKDIFRKYTRVSNNISIPLVTFASTVPVITRADLTALDYYLSPIYLRSYTTVRRLLRSTPMYSPLLKQFDAIHGSLNIKIKGSMVVVGANVTDISSNLPPDTTFAISWCPENYIPLAPFSTTPIIALNHHVVATNDKWCEFQIPFYSLAPYIPMNANYGLPYVDPVFDLSGGSICITTSSPIFKYPYSMPIPNPKSVLLNLDILIAFADDTRVSRYNGVSVLDFEPVPGNGIAYPIITGPITKIPVCVAHSYAPADRASYTQPSVAGAFTGTVYISSGDIVPESLAIIKPNSPNMNFSATNTWETTNLALLSYALNNFTFPTGSFSSLSLGSSDNLGNITINCPTSANNVKIQDLVVTISPNNPKTVTGMNPGTYVVFYLTPTLTNPRQVDIVANLFSTNYLSIPRDPYNIPGYGNVIINFSTLSNPLSWGPAFNPVLQQDNIFEQFTTGNVFQLADELNSFPGLVATVSGSSTVTLTVKFPGLSQPVPRLISVTPYDLGQGMLPLYIVCSNASSGVVANNVVYSTLTEQFEEMTLADDLF